ncbi:MAG: hypothetical protein QM802_10400 [Agriterribacter sp.]
MMRRKTLRRLAVIVVLVILVFCGLHFLLFPQQTRSILINFFPLKKDKLLYHRENISSPKVDSLQALIAQAKSKMLHFWPEDHSRPTIIYCDTDEDFETFGAGGAVPAITYLKLDGYIIVSLNGVDTNILAHEMMHVALYNRIGFITYNVKIPTWFDEGLAMQADDRAYYSEDTLKAKTNDFKKMPDITKYATGKSFQSGSPEEIMLHYLLAKHVVHLWYTPEKLETFIHDLQSGKSFESSFRP